MKFVQPIRDPEVIEAIKEDLRFSSIRDYLFFSFGVYSGLRVSDLLQLQKLDVLGSHVTIYEQKTGKLKKFIIHPDMRDELNQYIAELDDKDYLFPSRQKKRNGVRGRPIDRSQAYKMLNKIASRYGLQEIGCHTLRKTWGYHLYQADPRTLALLMQMFNHTSEWTTLRYLGLTQDAMDKAISRLSYSKKPLSRTRTG